MADNVIDVKTETASSPASDVKDTGAASSTVTTAQTTKGDNTVAPKTMAEAVRQAIPSVSSEAPPAKEEVAEKEEAESPVQDLNETKGEEAETVKTEEIVSEEKVKEGEEVKDETEDKGPIPYERFQEKVQEVQMLNKTLEDSKPLIDAQRNIETFCQANSITNDDFKNAMEIAALLKRDPLAAWDKLKPIVDGIAVLQGEKLTPDLQKSVDDGEITLDYAKRLAKAEAQKQFSAEQGKVNAQRTAFEAQNKLVTDTQTALNTWQSDKKSKDTSYKPKANVNSPDGLWELVNDKWFSLMQVTPPKTAAEAVSLAEKAYTQVKASIQQFTPRPPVKKALSSNLSSATAQTNGKPKSMLDAVKRHLAEVGS